jgi:hypothetical protein
MPFQQSGPSMSIIRKPLRRRIVAAFYDIAFAWMLAALRAS